MLERIIYSWSPEVKVMMAATLIFGIIIGVVTVIGLIMVLEQTPEEEEDTTAPRRLLSPRKHRRESETRAALQARMMVASGAFQAPTRR